MIFGAIIKLMQIQSLLKQTPIKTPNKSRPYLHSYSLHKTPAHNNNVQDDKSILSQNENEIFGTNISPNRVKAELQKFILEFEVNRIVEQQIEAEKIYLNQLNQISGTESQSCLFEVDGRHIREYDQELYLRLIYFPAEMISCFDFVIRGLYNKYFVEPQTDEQTRDQRIHHKEQLMVNIKHLASSERISIRDLSPKHIGRLVALQGIVLRVSQIYPEMKQACFRCANAKCRNTLHINLENARVQQPQHCMKCRQKSDFQLMHNNCKFTDKQFVKFQELNNYVAEGETPSSIAVLAYDSNVDSFRPGDRVEMVGIYRAYGVKIDRSRSNLKAVFNTYIDLLSCSMLEENRFQVQEQKTVFSDQERRQFYKMAAKEDVIEDLTNSFAPSIFSHNDVKKGILTQLFGGTKAKQTRGRFRSDINICLIGDPSTAKSQLLQQVHKIAPRSLYTSGRGSSAVGLTANVRKDPETRQFVLESGALVLSDKGICCIDEFDKMDENSRTILLEAMEQQTISIAKAGIVCQLNSRTSILAAANPVNSKYDPKKSVVENINLPPTLLSRFDLIYIILDLPNEQHDRRLATHILDLYSDKSPVESKQGVYSMHLLARYISFAKEYVHPQITEAAGKKLSKEYQEMRQKGQSRHTITATPRQLESLIRMSEAFAKMRLSSQVIEDDVDQAINLMNLATLKTATDPETGMINLDIITTGKSQSVKQRAYLIAGKIKQIIEANESKYRKSNSVDNLEEDLIKMGNLGKTGATKQEILEALRILQTDDFLVLYGQNKSKMQFKLQRISM